jgi:small-conductance mechanosensitive channel
MVDGLRRVLGYPLEIGEVTLTLGNIVLFVLAVYVAFWLAKTIRAVLAEEVLPNMSLPRGVGNSVSTLTYYGVVLLGFLVALAVAGFEVGQFAIVFGALGVGIGFGLQNVVNNFVSGLILMFERPIQPGDVVEVTGTSGRVREIGMRATTLTTFEGADVVVPNGSLLSDKLINWTLSDMNRRLDVNVGVAYGTDPKRVIDLLLDVARSTQGVATDPEPIAIFAGFGASSLDFTLRAWTNNFAEWVRIRSNLTVGVHDAIVGAGIEIPFPQQDLHLRSVSPKARAGLAGETPPGPA